VYIYVFEDCIYLFEREGERAQAGGAGEGEAVSRMSGEPHVGLNPRTLSVCSFIDIIQMSSII